MKTMKTILAVVAFVASAHIAFAGNGGQSFVSMVPISGKKVAVSVQTKGHDVYRLKLRSESGQILHESKTDKSGNYQKIFDLAKLEDGNYSISINNTSSKAERQFAIKDGSVIVGKHSYESAPVFSYRDNVLRVAYLNYEDHPVSITVYNEDNAVVYSKEINKDFAVNEGINFAKVQRGDYQVVLGSANENYSYRVKK
ncbi:MAG: hypothetical protein ACK5JS_08715 [Mangrovibacterium sp.]